LKYKAETYKAETYKAETYKAETYTPIFIDCTLRRRKGWQGVSHVWPASQAVVMSFVSHMSDFIFTWNELIN